VEEKQIEPDHFDKIEEDNASMEIEDEELKLAHDNEKQKNE